MKIDLHAHSVLSDGTDTPTELVRAAAAAGLDVVALSDHDHARGWDEATAEAAVVGLDVVPAIELSTRHRGRGVHLLAYHPDPDHPGLAEGMRRTREGRDERLEAWVLAGERAGIPIDAGQVLARSRRSFSVSKNHVADVLVEAGHAADRQAAFDDLLAEGKPLFVVRFALELTEAVRLVREAGGAPVLAHPWGRTSRRVLDAEEIARLAGLGLVGLEVDHVEHDAEDRAVLRAVARDLDLVATGSSDYHGTHKWQGLGEETTDPAEYERLLATCALAAGTGGAPRTG